MNRVCAKAREIMKPLGKKTNTVKRALKVLTVPLAACALMFGATSASADQAVPYSNHTVKTVNPTGTTVNLFDYWVVDGDNDSSANINNDNKNDNTGINKGRQLKFNGGAGTGINKWTGRSGTAGYGRLRFVENQLVNGYPAIKKGTYTSQGNGVNYTDESLAYLFNNDSQNGKAVYNNVQGLFQLKNGYYVYDSYGSNGNYAVYNPTTNSFNVYDKAGVYKGDASKETNLGQFFPFDSARKVFEERNGQLSPLKITDGTNDTLNHHFGMSMTTEFVQPKGGQTTDGDMIFEFSGDDDVWVYIDGVLVGDLGGIHEKATLKINFATGAVHVGHVDNANDEEKTIEDTTILNMFEAAKADTSNFSGSTFRESSKHKLSFFYLERGAGASNMKLKFNLTTLPSSEVEKVNQNGEAVQGAKFALYQSDESWKTQGDPIALGTTDDKGQLVLLKPDRSVISFDNQHAEGHDYFVLKEIGLPAGYRSSLTSSTTATPGELHLQYKEAATSGSGGVVVAPQTTVKTADGKPWKGSRMWLNGGYLAAKETISLSQNTKDNKRNPISSGTTFAVVLKRTDKSKADTDESAWTPVTGNPLDGYKLCSAHGIAGAVEAAKSADTNVFAVNTKGDYEVTVRSLPGDIEKYAAMMTDKSNSEYTVAVYHTTASSLAEATTENTSMVEYQATNRQFSTVIHLTNVQNRLFVQKVDDLGEPVNGATFQLYKADDVTGNSPSTYAIRPGATPYDTVQANGLTYPYEIEGAACFPLNSVNHAPLIKGTYYLRESGSPDGYELNTTITKVIVEDSGVYVDAGDEFDGVRSMSGPGSLIASLAQFGSPDSIDNTLTHIKGKLQSATGMDAKGNLTWGQTSTAKGVTPTLADGLMHMRYDKTMQGTKTVLRYVEDKGVRDGRLATIYADTGINRMALYQEDDSSYIDDASKTRTNLGTLQLNHLFTTATAVQYTDRRVARLQVTKTVTADNGLTAPTKDANDNDLTFTFKFALPESQKGYEAHVFDANGKPVGDSFTLKNGYTHSIKAGETIRVYDLKKDDSYSVSELTTKGEESNGNVLASIVNTVTGSADESVLPAGFSLVSRKAGGEEQSGTGSTITGTIAALEGGEIPASNKLEFTNNYSASSVKLEGKDLLKVEKKLIGRDWTDDDTFTVKLTPKDGAPMPKGAKSQASTVKLTMKAPEATFGDITYTEPGTYTYIINEVIPGSDAGADGISYSAAVYTAKVVVEDNQAGALVVTSVKMVQKCNDAGEPVTAEVAGRVATFINRYDEHEKNIIIHAKKNLTDNAGTFPLAQNTFSFTLEGVGGLADINATFNPNAVDKSVKAPMPQGAEGNAATVGNNADGTVTWPAISYTAKRDAGHAYVYKFAEVPGSAAGMTYDGSVYYAVVRNVKKGAGIQTSIEYYRAMADGSVKQLDQNATPLFTNIYSVEPTSVTLQGQKTLSGRGWNQGESYTFNLTAATDDDSATSLGKTTKQAVTDGAVAINANQTVASAPESGRVASFAFGTEAAPALTFNRAGTFSFNITEDTAQGQAGMSMDKHTARATVVVTDLDERGNRAGKLRVSSVIYTNTDASDADKDITDKAAFTNAYHASGTFGGVTVSKTLEGRASTAGQFTFAVTGLWYNGVQMSVDGAEANLSNKAAEAGVSGAVVGTSGTGRLFARALTEQDLGRTYAYRIHENQPAPVGYTYDTGYTGDAIVLVKVLARQNDPAKLYTVTTVLKGAGVTELLGDGADASELTDEKIAELKQDPNTYVQQYDASEAGATTPTVSFVNRYTASLDYGTAGGIQIEKTLTYPKDATVFGSPKSTFRYIVKPADEASAKKVGITMDGKVFETANVEANIPKTVSLVPERGLTFTQNDAGKTFTYTVAEIDDKATGYTYDKTVHAVKAVVADNGDGTLKVTTSVSKKVDGKDELEGQWIYPSDATSTGVATIKFKNTYTVTEAATYTPSVTKVVAGRDAEEKFTFTMTAADDATRAAVDNNLITGSLMSKDNGYAEQKKTKDKLADGEHDKIDFSTLTFNKPGTYKFAINEAAPNSGLGEWKYDQHVYTVTVTVTDEGGKLVARADGTTGANGFVFTNSYQTSTSYELQGGLEIVKTLKGKDLHAGMFGFTVTGEDDPSIAKLKALLRQEDGKLTVTNDEPEADGTSHTGILGGLTFTTSDAGKTFTYKVVENSDKKGGYTYDTSYWTVSITVVNKRTDGSLYTVTTVKHFDADKKELFADEKNSENGPVEAQVSFTNSYAASGTFEGLHAQKVMDSGDKIEADQYTFDVYAEKADGTLQWMDKGTTQAGESGTATVDFGKVDFKLGKTFGGSHELTIDLDGAVNDGIATKRHNADHTTTYSFNLVAKERLDNLPEGVRPVDTSATCRVLLEVTDDNNGNLTSKVTYRDGTENGKIVFHNTRDKVKTIGTVAKPSVDIDGQLLSVGDSYVYTINWVNTEADAGNLVSANVTVTDELPAGVVFEAFEGKNADKGAANGQSLTWNLGEQPAGSHGSVRVRAKITEDVVKDARGAVGTINNTATVTVGNKSYTGTTTNYVPKKSESDAQDSTGAGVKLGDELIYTIGYKNTESKPATVTITDTVPAGTEFVEFAGDHADIAAKDKDGNLTWTLTDVPAGEEGTVQFKVRVTEGAFKSGGASDDISNQASVTVGNNPAVKTNTTTDEASDGRLTLSKTVTAAEGITAPNKAFTFKVLLYQADGATPLTSSFAYAGRPSGTNGTYVSGQIKSGDTIALKAGGSVTVTVPVGAHYEVQELDSRGNLMTSEDGFAVADKTNTQAGTVGQATQVGFTNIYSVESTKVENAFKVQKKISGRNWTTSDAFTMTLAAEGEAPMPKGAKDGVSTIALSKDVQVGNFGTIEYTKPGTYTYVIAEQAGDETALTFSKATYRATVTVTDDGAGKLAAETKIAQLTDDAGSAVERTVEAAVFTNTAKTGSLTVKKTVVGGDSQREFGFTVTLTDGDGEPVSGTFGKGESAVTFTDGRATFTLKHGGEKAISDLPVGANYTVTEDAAEGYTTTAEGAEGTVTEDGATAAFTNTYGTATEGRDVSTAGLFTKALKGRDWAEGDSFQFTLTGEAGAPMPEGSSDGSKTVSVTAADGTKAGDRVAFDFGSIRYTLDDIRDAGFAEVGGKRVRAKTFTYTVREVRPADGSAIAGVAYDGHAATMTVTVTDDGSGNLTATTPAIAQASGGDFVNTYTTELDYSARAGVLLSKTLFGRDMEAGQFAFTVTADDETAAKLGLKTGKDAYAVSAAGDGEADFIDLIGGAAEGDVTFTDADAGKTYSFTVAETKLGDEGYTNDIAPRTVTIAPAYDAATGKLAVTTTVAKDGVEVARSEVSTADDATAPAAPVTVAFQNSYEATGALGGEGSVAISATKTLTGRAATAGEFSFSVRDAHGNVVATASNQASGDGKAAALTFSPIAYTTDALEQMVADGTATRADDGSWSIPYTVSEDTAALPAGVTATASSFDITVKVTDNGKGGLDAAVVYPEGSDGTLSFVNGYGTNEATVDLAGTKTLALGQAGLGLTQADIADKYTFKIEPLDGAPAPVDASGKTVTEATNDAAGNIVLGHVTFKQPSDLDDVKIDGDGLRSKTFAYRVSESGSVDGVANDAAATKIFTVKVVENINAGTLKAEVLLAEGTPQGKGAFEFTNTYGVGPAPSFVTDQIKVNKKLKGRDLVEGEFEFQLVEISADGSENVTATGRNAADGTVALGSITYTAPGSHSYELREVVGTAGGVTYDRAIHRVRTTVTDAGNGTLAVMHELVDSEGNPTGDDSVAFTNGYEAAPVTLKLGAAKVLKGAELKAGQFSFELKSRDGKVMSTARNAADGGVTFDALTFKQAGTYTFTVSEVDDGQAHVTYDRAVHKIVVTVSDEDANGAKTGYLSAKVSYEGDANVPPVFTNSYAEEPGTPGTPENPGTPGGGSGGGSDSGSGGSSGGDGSKGGMPDTGDRSLPVEALAAMAGIGALAVAGGAALYRRRR